jgi:hypothetical protein
MRALKKLYQPTISNVQRKIIKIDRKFNPTPTAELIRFACRMTGMFSYASLPA